MPEMLVSASELLADLGTPGLVVVDCRASLSDPEAGRAAWEQGHIPEARHADLERDLSGPVGPETGRHPLPDPARFAETLGGWGIEPSSRVVVYDDVGGAIAARLWWLLRWVGHDDVALLDGGLSAYLGAGGTLETDAPVVPASRPYPVTPGSLPVVTTDDVEEGMENGRLLLLDARDPERFEGRVEPIDAVAGHIPGALNHPFRDNLDAEGCFLPREKLRDRLEAQLAGKDKPIAAMCGSGVTACHNVFALEYAGLATPGQGYPALYAGSWSEWIRSDDRGVAVTA